MLCESPRMCRTGAKTFNVFRFVSRYSLEAWLVDRTLVRYARSRRRLSILNTGEPNNQIRMVSDPVGLTEAIRSPPELTHFQPTARINPLSNMISHRVFVDMKDTSIFFALCQGSDTVRFCQRRLSSCCFLVFRFRPMFRALSHLSSVRLDGALAFWADQRSLSTVNCVREVTVFAGLLCLFRSLTHSHFLND
jgi:hypothetical protein